MAHTTHERPESRQKPEEDVPPAPRHRPTAREELIRDPNLNQAGNGSGSLDQTQGSQTGNDIDLIPET